MITVDKTETRELLSAGIEIRSSENGVRTIYGYAVKWEMKSSQMGFWYTFQEQFKKGSFSESLTNDDQRALWSHDISKVLGRTKNGTLRLFEDDIGLRFEVDLPNNTLGDDTYETINRGDVDGVSFGFSASIEEWDESDPENVIRTITKAKLIEISPVAFPAYPDSQVSARSNDPYKNFLEARHKKDLRKKLILKTFT